MQNFLKNIFWMSKLSWDRNLRHSHVGWSRPSPQERQEWGCQWMYTCSRTRVKRCAIRAQRRHCLKEGSLKDTLQKEEPWKTHRQIKVVGANEKWRNHVKAYRLDHREPFKLSQHPGKRDISQKAPQSGYLLIFGWNCQGPFYTRKKRNEFTELTVILLTFWNLTYFSWIRDEALRWLGVRLKGRTKM